MLWEDRVFKRKVKRQHRSLAQSIRMVSQDLWFGVVSLDGSKSMIPLKTALRAGRDASWRIDEELLCD